MTSDMRQYRAVKSAWLAVIAGGLLLTTIAMHYQQRSWIRAHFPPKALKRQVMQLNAIVVKLTAE